MQTYYSKKLYNCEYPDEHLVLCWRPSWNLHGPENDPQIGPQMVAIKNMEWHGKDAGNTYLKAIDNNNK